MSQPGLFRNKKGKRYIVREPNPIVIGEVPTLLKKTGYIYKLCVD